MYGRPLGVSAECTVEVGLAPSYQIIKEHVVAVRIIFGEDCLDMIVHINCAMDKVLLWYMGVSKNEADYNVGIHAVANKECY